jgi:hypothetical protein
MQSPIASRAGAAPLGDDPSRRRFLAAGSAVTVFASLRAAIAQAEGDKALAGAVSTVPLSEALAQAIERHRAAWAAYEAGYDEDNEDAFSALVSAADGPLADLVAASCANDSELLAKLRYLHSYEKSLIRGRPFDIADHGSIPAALDVHFNAEA